MGKQVQWEIAFTAPLPPASFCAPSLPRSLTMLRVLDAGHLPACCCKAFIKASDKPPPSHCPLLPMQCRPAHTHPPLR